MRFLKAVVAAIPVGAVIWFIPTTARVIESLLRSAILSLGLADDLMSANVAIAKGILALALWMLLLVLFAKRR